MSSSLLTVFIVAFIGMVIGFLAATIATSARGEEKSDSGKRKLPAYLVETARLWRDKRNGALLVEKNGRFLRSSTGLSQSQHTELAKVVADLAAWLENEPPPSQAAAEAPAPVIVTPPPASFPQKPSAIPSPVAGETFYDNPPPRVGLIQSVTRAIDSANVPKVEAQPKSITTQIDEIIHEKAYGTPFAQRSIRLADSPDQGVVVYVGLDRYIGVEAVPDADIRAFIRECVAEWERRHARGG